MAKKDVMGATADCILTYGSNVNIRSCVLRGGFPCKTCVSTMWTGRIQARFVCVRTGGRARTVKTLTSMSLPTCQPIPQQAQAALKGGLKAVRLGNQTLHWKIEEPSLTDAYSEMFSRLLRHLD